MTRNLDIYHEWGADLMIGPGGDLQTAEDTVLVRQRVLRRLLTNPGDYIWHTQYGAGLARFVGLASSDARIRSVIIEQLRREPGVTNHPPPSVSLQKNTRDDPNTVNLDINYQSAIDGIVQTVAVKVGAST